MKTRYLILFYLVFISLAQINECFTLIQGLRQSVSTFLLIPLTHSYTHNARRPVPTSRTYIRRWMDDDDDVIPDGPNLTIAEVDKSRGFMRLIDTEFPIYDHNDYDELIIAIVQHKPNDDTIGSGQIISTGVFINEDHVLTSYNPFRNLIRAGHKMRTMRIYYYKGKWWENFQTDISSGYIFGIEKFECARAVVPHEVHNSNHWAETLHDLMVIKTVGKVIFRYDIVVWSERSTDPELITYPSQAELAGMNDYFGDTLNILSLGFMDDDHIMNRNHLHSLVLDEWVIVDCDEYLLHTGYFICVEDVENYEGIGSGSFLFSDWKVFGVGSFSLKRGEKHIMVFTDVRPFVEMIKLTCTEADVNINKGWWTYRPRPPPEKNQNPQNEATLT